MKRKILLRTALLATTLMLFGSVGWGQYSGTGTFNKITSIEDLVPGYYVIVNSGDAFAMNNTNAGTFFAHTAVTPSSNVITNPSVSIVWKIETSGASWSLFNEETSKYVSYTGSSNAAYAVDEVTSDNQRWTFTYGSNVFTASNAALTTRMLQYNASSPRFACYTTSQQKLLLYKYEEPAGNQVNSPAFNPVAGTYTEPTDVTISTSTEGATVYYSLVSETGPWTEYTTAISVTETTTIWAYATKTDMDNSNVSSATYTFPVTRKWSGLGAAGDWADADNWSPVGVPTSADPVILDNSIITDNYTVNLPSGSTVFDVYTLTITPSSEKFITLNIPKLNTANPGIRINGSGDALVINEGGVLMNSTGALSGSGIVLTATGALIRINNGGHYIHNNPRAHAAEIVAKLSTVAGTESGIFEFDIPKEFANVTISTAARTYGNLVLSGTDGNRTYIFNSTNPLTVKSNLIINENVTLESSLKGADVINQNLIIEASGRVTFNNDNTLTVDKIILKTDATRKAASLINNGTLTVNTVEYQRYMPNGAFEYVSSPVAGQTASVFGTLGENSAAGNGLFAFDVTSDSWSAAITNGATPIVAMQGYAFIANSNQTVTFSGTGFYSGEQSIGLVNSATGFNLVGNPYPSAINWDADAGWTRGEDIDPVIWINTADAPGASNFATFNHETPEASTNWESTVGTDEGVIAPTQAFWVYAADNVSLAVNNAAQVHSANVVNKKSTSENPLIRLQAQRSGYSDEMVIYFHSEATEGMDRFDTRKKLGSGAYPQIYAPVADAMAAVNTLPQSLLSEKVVVPITLKSDMAGSITMALTELKNLGDDMNITLTDKATGSQTDLRTAAYTVEVEAGSTLTNRFEVTIERKNVTSAPAIDKSTVNIYASAKNIYVGMAQQGSRVEVYNAIGVQMLSQTLNGGAVESIPTNLPKGVYIVVVNGSEGRTVKRVFIQ